MKVSVVTRPLEQVRAGALVVLLAESGPAATPAEPSLARHVESFARAVAKGTTRGEWFCTLEKDSPAATRHLLLDAVSFGTWMPAREKLKTTAARAAETCRRYSIADLAFACPTKDAEEFAAAVLEGAALGDFFDQRFKSAPEMREALKLQFVVAKGAATGVRRAVAERLAVVEGVNFARELVNAPNNVLTPAALAREARALARKHRMACEVLDERAIARQGYRLLEHVGRGSEHPPRLIVLRHKPARKPRLREHVVLLGKGICFDTGGYCIKGGDSMHTMNGDMAGAGAVLGAMRAIAALELPLRVTAIIPAAVNAIDGRAYIPGSIIKSKNGKTVYIENTDAEGRLVLADGFERAREEKADVVVDFATLTGSAGVALGPQIAALFGDDVALVESLRAAGDATGDDVWHLPLFREYETALKHPLADLNNITPAMNGRGGAIHAANFLRAFVPKGVRWAHLDMSMPARAKGKTRYFGPGATGFGVRLIVRAMQDWIERGRI